MTSVGYSWDSSVVGWPPYAQIAPVMIRPAAHRVFRTASVAVRTRTPPRNARALVFTAVSSIACIVGLSAISAPTSICSTYREAIAMASSTLVARSSSSSSLTVRCSVSGSMALTPTIRCRAAGPRRARELSASRRRPGTHARPPARPGPAAGRGRG